MTVLGLSLQRYYTLLYNVKSHRNVLKDIDQQTSRVQSSAILHIYWSCFMLICQPKMLIKCNLHYMSMLYMWKCAQNAFQHNQHICKTLDGHFSLNGTKPQSTKAAGTYHLKVSEIVWDLNSRNVARAGLGVGVFVWPSFSTWISHWGWFGWVEGHRGGKLL